MKLTNETIRAMIEEEIKKMSENCGCEPADPMQQLDDALASGDIELARQILVDIRATEAPQEVPPAPEMEMY